MEASTSSGLKLAARLSPPLSSRIRSRPGCRAIISSIASKFIEASSRIAVCGQPPARYRRVRPPPGLPPEEATGRERFAAQEELHVLAREDVVGDAAEPVPAAHR